MTTSEPQDSPARAARSLRVAAITGGVGIVSAMMWGFYILLGLSMGGMVLGRNRTFDAIAVVPALGLGILLLCAASVALRAFRRARATPRLVAGALFLVETALGISLCGYGAWAGIQVARTRLARGSGGRPSQTAGERTITIVAPATRR